MVIGICPRCNERYVSMTKDLVHDCGNTPSASEALKNEDIVVVGDWEDYDGTGSIGPAVVMTQGVQNTLWGQRADIEGEDNETVTSRGNPINTFRTRGHLEFIDKKC